MQADQVLAALRVDELSWEEIKTASGLNVSTMESVIPWMVKRGELVQTQHMDVTRDSGGVWYYAKFMLPDDLRLAYALEMAQFKCEHRQTRSIYGPMLMECKSCGAQRNERGVWHGA